MAAEEFKRGRLIPSSPRKPKSVRPSVYRYKNGKFAVVVWLRSEKRGKYLGYFDSYEAGYQAGLVALELYNGKESIGHL